MGDDGEHGNPEPVGGELAGDAGGPENAIPLSMTLSFEEYWKAAPDALPADPTRFIDQLVEQSSSNPGLPFERWIVSRLVKLRQRDRAAYERLLPRLKSARLRVGELDKLVTRQSGDDLANDNLPGQPLTWEEDEPWPDQVDGAALLDEIVLALRRLVVVNNDQADAITLWVVAAHALDCFDIFPRLAIWSPVKRCGKTTTLELLSHVAPRALATSNISAAAIFRVVDKAQPALLVDETETFAGENEETHGILNSGHKRTLAYVIRTVGDDHKPRKFSTWCPMAVALIGKLWPTLADRSIEIALRRRSKADRVERLHSNGTEQLVRLRRMAACWVEDHAAELTAWDGKVPALHDRAADNWRPLLAVADRVGGTWPERARAAALAVSGVEDTDSDVAVELLADIRTLFDATEDDKLRTKAILEGLHAMEDRPWKEWGKRGSPISDRQMAKMLKRFEIESKTIRLSDDYTPKGYDRAVFEDAWQRYLPADTPADTAPSPPVSPLPSATTPQPAPQKDFRAFSQPPQNSDVADESAEKTVVIQDMWPCGGSGNQRHLDAANDEPPHEYAEPDDPALGDDEPDATDPALGDHSHSQPLPQQVDGAAPFVPFKLTGRLPPSSLTPTPCAMCGDAEPPLVSYRQGGKGDRYWFHPPCCDFLVRRHGIRLEGPCLCPIVTTHSAT
jgi:hypothetical protein